MKYNEFHSHHSPWGAYCSFVMGKPGQGGGFVMNDVRAPQSDIYIGYKEKGEATYVLPFCEVKETDYEEAFGIGKIGNEKWITKVKTIQPQGYTRTYSPSTDEWNYNKLSFKLYSPITELKDYNTASEEEIKRCCVPGIIAELSYDNSNSDKEVTLFFGMSQLGRLVGDYSETLVGGAGERLKGFATYKGTAEDYIGMNAIASIVEETTHKYKLGNHVLIQVKVKPHEIKLIPIALATYQEGSITSGLATRFAYTNYFEDLEEVLNYLLDNRLYYINLAQKNQQEMIDSNLSEDRKRLLAHSYHSYLASTQLMLTKEDKPVWIVNEGEYRMMNTLDLTVDHLFYELKYHPWTVINVLDFFWERHSYFDEVRDINGKSYEGGISFSHDCGVGNMFSALHSSAYEVDQAVGCFSYMTIEQLLNWSLCASTYGLLKATKMEQEKLAVQLKLCFQSIQNRDRNMDGIIDCDSLKAQGQSEITTYDSLDHSLAQARDNLYVAVKTWATCLCMSYLFVEVKQEEQAISCRIQAELVAKSIVEQYQEELGYIPSIFYKKDTAKIIPAIEALVYPFYCGKKDDVSEIGPFGALIKVLKKHFTAIMKPGVCIDEGNGGWKLTSNNTNTWMSKIYISQFVAESILGCSLEVLSPKADEAHVKWQFEGCSNMCSVDQVNCSTGSPIGSRLYPRLVTSVLWLGEK